MDVPTEWGPTWWLISALLMGYVGAGYAAARAFIKLWSRYTCLVREVVEDRAKSRTAIVRLADVVKELRDSLK